MSGDGKENAQCSTAHNLPLLQNWNYSFLSWPGLMFVCPRFSGALAILVEIKQ